MHIVYIITKLELGGAQKVCLTLFKDLKKYDVTTRLISSNQGVLVDQVKNDPTAILLPTLVRELSLFGLINEVKTFFTLIQTLRNFRKENPDLIVHTHSTKAGLLGRWAAFFARVPHIVHTVHGFGFNDQQPRIVWAVIWLLEVLTACITDHFIVVSQADAVTGMRLLPFFKSHYTLIRAAAATHPTEAIPQKILPQDAEQPIIFGTLSCLKPQKNVRDMITFFAQLCNKSTLNLRLEIVGDGVQRQQLEEYAQQLGIAQRITFVGWQQDIQPWLMRWHFFVLTSLWEGLPCSVIEARLFKLPVLAYDTGGIHEIIKNTINGFVVAQHDINQLNIHARDLLNNPNMYNQLANYQDDLDDFEPEHMVKSHLALYKSL